MSLPVAGVLVLVTAFSSAPPTLAGQVRTVVLLGEPSARFEGVLLAQAQPSVGEGSNEDVLTTKSGKVLRGKILRETERGFLFKQSSGETLMVEYSDVDDIKRVDSGKPKSEVAAPAAPPKNALEAAPQVTEERLRRPLPNVEAAPPPPRSGYRSDSNPPPFFQQKELQDKLLKLKEERASMVSGTVSLVTLGAGTLVWLFVSIPVGLVVAGVGAVVGIFYLISSHQLDQQIAKTEVELERLKPIAAPPALEGGADLVAVARF